MCGAEICPDDWLQPDRSEIRFEVLAVERTTDHVASEGGAVYRIPANFNVPINSRELEPLAMPRL